MSHSSESHGTHDLNPQDPMTGGLTKERLEEIARLAKKLRTKTERVHDLSGVGYNDDADCHRAADLLESLSRRSSEAVRVKALEEFLVRFAEKVGPLYVEDIREALANLPPDAVALASPAIQEPVAEYFGHELGDILAMFPSVGHGSVNKAEYQTALRALAYMYHHKPVASPQPPPGGEGIALTALRLILKGYDADGNRVDVAMVAAEALDEIKDSK